MFAMAHNEGSILLGCELSYLVALDTLADIWSVARVAGFVGRGNATMRFEDGPKPITSDAIAYYVASHAAARLAEAEAHEARYNVRFCWLDDYRRQVA